MNKTRRRKQRTRNRIVQGVTAEGLRGGKHVRMTRSDGKTIDLRVLPDGRVSRAASPSPSIAEQQFLKHPDLLHSLDARSHDLPSDPERGPTEIRYGIDAMDPRLAFRKV